MKQRFFLYAVILLCGLYSVRWITTRPTIDFPAFYSAGRLFREGKQPYDLKAQCQVQGRITTIGCLPFAHPPLLLPVMALTAVDNWLTARVLYGSFLWLLFVACLWPLKRLTGSWLHAAALLTFFPVVQSLQATQSTPLVLFGVCWWAMLLSERKDFWAGAALALALVKPHLAIALGLPLIFVRPKAFLGFLCGGAVVAFYTLALVGPEGIKGILSITQVMARADGYYVDRDKMYNLAGLLARNDLNVLLIWPAYLFGIAIISLLWRKYGTKLPLLGVAVIVSLFVSPHLHLHDLSLLIVPMLCLPMWAPLAGSVVIGVGFGHWWLYSSVYTLMGALGILDYKQSDERHVASIYRVPELSHD